jgi:DNA-binding CsgD family transcriptional regulator
VSIEVFETAEGLMQLDPIRSYPERGANLVAKVSGAAGFRLELVNQVGEIEGGRLPATGGEQASLPLRHGRQVLGTLHLFFDGRGGTDLSLARWGARLLSRGMSYAQRLAAEGGRRREEDLEETLARTPLTPRERDVVILLVAGSSTREIAERTGLTVATVNTYLKRIFSKLGVHSRVELVARVAGTAAQSVAAPPSDGAAPAASSTDESSDDRAVF